MSNAVSFLVLAAVAVMCLGLGFSLAESLFLLGILFGFQLLLNRVFDRRRILAMARSRRAGMIESFGKKHDFRSVRAEDFPDSDHEWYKWASDYFVSLGCSVLGDFQDASTKFSAKTFTRVMILPEGRGTVSITQMVLPRTMNLVMHFLGTSGKIIEFEVEFSDGSFLNVSNFSRAKNLISMPENVELRTLPDDSSPDVLYKAFLQAEDSRLEKNHGLSCRAVRTMEEFLAGQERLAELNRAYRESAGWVTREEAAQYVSGEDLERFMAEIDRLNREHSGQGNHSPH